MGIDLKGSLVTYNQQHAWKDRRYQSAIRHLTAVLITRCSSNYLRQVLPTLTPKETLKFADELSPSNVVPADFRIVMQLAAFYKKNDRYKDESFDPRVAAIRESARCENDCHTQNQILSSLMSKPSQFSGSTRDVSRMNAVLAQITWKIAKILGTAPRFSELNCRFGPGATIGLPRRLANAVRKLTCAPTCSEGLVGHLDKFIGAYPHLADRISQCTVSPAKLDFVPKNYKTDRPIAIEPWLNTFVQLGIGDAIERRLRSVGVDVRDQSRNQRLARFGSETGTVATIDLSSASDTICSELVYQVIPEDWLRLLNAARSARYSYGDRTYRSEKFSSMGNGFTFPLQTLIFYAIACVCSYEAGKTDFLVSAYGDDIIVPTEAYSRTIDTLTLLGFRPNARKSYGSGPFRESCGADYIHGINVRPVFLRDGRLSAFLFQFHNMWTQFDPVVAQAAADLIPPPLRIYGPPGYGHGHLWKEGFRATPTKAHLAKGYTGYCFSTWSPVVAYTRHKLRIEDESQYYPVYSIYLGTVVCQSLYVNDDLCLDGREVVRYRKTTIYVLG